MRDARTKWNDKYRLREGDTRVDPFLIDNAHQLNRGSALDLACGLGQNSFYLADKGWKVTSVDISDEAVRTIRDRAREERSRVTPLQIDLEDPGLDYTQSLGRFDNLLIFNYKPNDALWQVLPTLLHPGGVLMYCTFNTKHHRHCGFPERFCLLTGEHTSPPSALELLYYEDIFQDDQYRDGYVFRRLEVVQSGDGHLGPLEQSGDG